MISLKKLYYGAAKAVNGICDAGFYQERPTAVEIRPDSYIVITFPSAIYNNEIDQTGSYNDYVTTLQLEIYVRDKASASNPNAIDVKAMDDKVTKVLKLFPIDNDVFHAQNPFITLQTSDNSGFHVTIIQAILRTK